MTDQNSLPTDTEININELPGITAKTDKGIDLFKLIIFVIISILIGSLIGGIAGKLTSKETTKIQTYKITKPVDVFPIDISILQNPMFSDWSGRLKGRIKKLNQSSFEISEIKEDFKPGGKIVVTDTNNPNLTEIEIVPDLTQFYISTPSSSPGQTAAPIAFSEIKNNSIVEGRVKINYDASSNKFKLIGVSLTLR